MINLGMFVEGIYERVAGGKMLFRQADRAARCS